MDLPDLVNRLGYQASPNYLRQEAGDLDGVVDYGHIFRRAVKPPCMLKGVYSLRESPSVSLPLVYVCDAGTEDDAKEIHRLVWNQNVVPFLIVNSPQTVRLYPGFCHGNRPQPEPGVQEVLTAYRGAEMARIIAELSAGAIDSGRTWRQWGRYVRPEYRVDWRLLESLKKLDRWLQSDTHLDSEVSHALIGKYVYLHYLRDRDILSQRKLDGWGIPADAVFGRDATVEGLRRVTEELDGWLNGAVFPINFASEKCPRDEHVRRVAGTFAGDQPLDDGTWQLHLDFQAYEFSYIPIETLSVVYEQFLHAPGKNGKSSPGRSKGAYYTPIPVVNLMLSEIEEHRPLAKGTRIFDPACGSGAFLVQAFRRLIEKAFPPPKKGGLDPIELRDLLTAHIFGVDTDPDACGVTELSLILTLLDYVDPPDLENGRPGRKPKLPKLRGENIFCDDFFNEEGSWRGVLERTKPAWIVGNPPWKQLNPGKLLKEEKLAWDWMQAKANRRDRPVGSNQMARAFAWRVADFLAEDGEVAMFLPAMTLFEDPARQFRRMFLGQMKVHTVANFANLAEVISAGRFRVPGAAFFYTRREEGADEPGEDEAIRTYCPLVANQEATRPVEEGRRNESWSLTINASEIRDIPVSSVLGGSGLPWKIATWGSNLDARLLAALGRRVKSARLTTLADLARERVVVVSQGLELRAGDGQSEEVEAVEEVVGKPILRVKALKGMRSFFAFPKGAMRTVDPARRYVRIRGGVKLPLSVCRPPHVIVSAARNFAIYTDEYLIVPPRQIGIVSLIGDRDLLKAISVFLSSDFAFYHQFLTSTEFGVKRDRATLRALRSLPLPVATLGRDELSEWARLQEKLARATGEAFKSKPGLVSGACEEALEGEIVRGALLDELNGRVDDALGLAPEDRLLVHDLVRVRFQLNDGKLGREAVREPSPAEMRSYAGSLKSELDSFVEGGIGKRHRVDILYDDVSGMVQVDLIGDCQEAGKSSVARAGSATARSLEAVREHLREQRSQWVYFDRNLRIYDGTKTYILKPMQRFHWTQTQARIDAREIVDETLAGEA